jgi:hypothetical protein
MTPELDAFLKFDCLEASESPFGFRQFKIGPIMQEMNKCHKIIKALQGMLRHFVIFINFLGKGD